VLKHTKVCDPEGKTSKDTAGCILSPTADYSELAKFIRKDICHGEGDSSSPPAAPLFYKAIQRLMNSVSPPTSCHPQIW